MDISPLTQTILDTCFQIHTEVGAGVYENIYKLCLQKLLRSKNIKAESEVSLPVNLYGLNIETAYRIDLLVQDTIILELKAVNKIEEIHKIQ